MTRRDRQDTVDVTCPTCRTWLKVDVETGSILLEKKPKGPSTSFEEAMAAEKKRGRAIDSAFKKAVSTVEGQQEILDKKLREAMEKAKQEKDEPLPPREIDLD